MTDQDENEYQKYITKRTRELLKGKITSLPGISWGSEVPDPIYDPVSVAINRAYVQGWIDSEIDLIGVLSMLSSMGDDPSCVEELWNLAHKSPRTEEALMYRRDWLEYEYARERLKLAGIDPWGKRPMAPQKKRPRAAKAKQVKKAKR
jgi:hypothetical protein